MNRINDLIEKQFLTYDELAELTLSSYVESVIDNGNSGLHYGYKWFSVIVNDFDYDIYIKYD